MHNLVQMHLNSLVVAYYTNKTQNDLRGTDKHSLFQRSVTVKEENQLLKQTRVQSKKMCVLSLNHSTNPQSTIKEEKSANYDFLFVSCRIRGGGIDKVFCVHEEYEMIESLVVFDISPLFPLLLL